jgi:hypothetical protein
MWLIEHFTTEAYYVQNFVRVFKITNMAGNGAKLWSYVCWISVVGENIVLWYIGELCRSGYIVPRIPVAFVLWGDCFRGMRVIIPLPVSTTPSKFVESKIVLGSY